MFDCRTEREAIVANDQIRFADALASVNARRTADLERMHLQKFVDEGKYQHQLAAQVSDAATCSKKEQLVYM